MSDKDIESILKIAFENGIQKVHWTGGEPLLREGFVDLVSEARLIGFTTQFEKRILTALYNVLGLYLGSIV